jgi:hypothetical protein
MKLKIEEYDIGAVEAAMYLRDIEICSFGLTSLHRQGCRFLCPETKPFSTSPDKSVQGARQHCNRQGLRMDTLRQAGNVQSAFYIGIAAIRRCSFSPLPRHRRPGRRTTAITPITLLTIASGTARRQCTRHFSCARSVRQSFPYFPGGRDASFAATPTLRHPPVPANALAVPGM